MSDETNQQTPASTGEAQTSPTSGASPSTGAQNTGFRYTAGPGIPDMIVGKTPEQVAQEYNQLYEYALKSLGNNEGQQSAPQPPVSNSGYQHQNYSPPQYQTPPTGPQPPTPDEWQMDPATAYQKQREYDEATRYQPVIGGLQGQLASTNVALIRRDYANEFKKWGPEILQLADSIPAQNRTYDALERVVQIVRSNHIDDIVEEKWQERMKTMTPDEVSLRSGVAPATTAPAHSVDFNELPEGYRSYLEANRVDQSTLDEFLMGPAGSLYGGDLNQRRQGFVEAAKGGDVRTERPVQDDGTGMMQDKTKLRISEE